MARAYRQALAAAIVLAACAAAPARAEAPDTVCVLVPHFKDDYWLGVAYGIEQAAVAAGLAPRFQEAGGYRAAERQAAQIGDCVEMQAAAIAIGVVSADDPRLARAIAAARARVPVFGLVNETDAPGLSGFVGVDWRDMGRAVGAYLARRHPQGSAPARAIVVTGPSEAGWTGPLDAGLRAGLGRAALRIAGVFHADTGVRQQLAEVEAALARHGQVDYLIGSAPAIEAAMGLEATGVVPEMPALVATYASHSVLRGLADGKVLAAPFDDPIAQGSMAMDQIARALSGAAPAGERAGPEVRLLTGPKQGGQRARLSPPDYFPEIR